MKAEAPATPFLRFCIGTAILSASYFMVMFGTSMVIKALAL